MRTSAALVCASILIATTHAFAGDPPAPAQTPPATAPASQAPAPPPPEALAEAAHQTELARQTLKTKRYTQAAQLFESAAALSRQAIAAREAGQAWEQADRPERAADAYARAIAAGDTDANAKERLDALERSLGTLDVKAPPGWTVQLGIGTEAPAPARLHGVPGIHSLAIAAPDRAIVRRDVRLEVGKPVSITLKDEPVDANKSSTRSEPATNTNNVVVASPQTPAPRNAPPPPPPQSGGWRKPVGFTAVGFGAATLGATILLGFETLNAKNAFNQAPTRELYDHEQTLQTWTNIGLVAGSVLVVGGIVLLVWPSSAPAQADVTVGIAPAPNGGSLVGTF